MPEQHLARLREDPALFREAVNFTAAETGFSSRLIEKDYLCTLILQHLSGFDADLIFKGGTCLAKVHAGFYRLSEDLDFLIPTQVDASRAVRRRLTTGTKAGVLRIGERLPGLRVVTPLAGANESTQSSAVIGYEENRPIIEKALGPKTAAACLESFDAAAGR